jgi:hypothetical protein
MKTTNIKRDPATVNPTTFKRNKNIRQETKTDPTFNSSLLPGKQSLALKTCFVIDCQIYISAMAIDIPDSHLGYIAGPGPNFV